jgi:hypothetical protein
MKPRGNTRRRNNTMSKEQKLFHSTVTFTGVGSARIDNLTQEQAWAIQNVMRLIERKPPSYSANGDLLYHVTTELADKRQATTVEGGFLARLMRRFNAWAMGGCVIVALTLGAQEGFAQELRAKPVEPIRVALTFEKSEASGDFNEQLRAELNKLRRVAFVSNAVDFDLYVTSGPIIAGAKTIGYASAVAVVVGGRRDKPIRLMLILGPTAAETAQRTARRINEHFSKGGE